MPSLARVVHPRTRSSRAHSSSAAGSTKGLGFSCTGRFDESELLKDGGQETVEERARGARRALAACGGSTESLALRESGASRGARGR